MQVSRALSLTDPGPVTRTTTDDDVIDLSALIATLWRGKWVIAAIAGLAVLVGGYYAFVVATPLYRSTAVVMLETNQEQIVDLQSVVGGLSGDTSEVNSEVEVLRARGLMGKVVDTLDLTQDAEFNTDLRAPTTSERAKTWIKSKLGLRRPAPVVSPEEATHRTRDVVISHLLRAVTVRNVPLSLVFQVTVETEDPGKSARIADTIVEQYILNQIEVKFEATEQATQWLSGRVAELQVTLEQAEAEVSAFSASTDLVSVAGMQALERQIKELRDRIDTGRAAQAGLAVDLAKLEDAQPRTQPVEITRTRAALARAKQQLVALTTSEAQLNAELDRQGADLITLQQLTREAEATRVLYEYFLARFNETSAQQGIQQADSRILSNAVVPLNPSEPRKSLILGMAGMLGLMAGVGLVLLREARSNSFRTAQDLEQATGYTVLGQIPTMPVGSRRKVLTYLSDKPTSAASEAYRNLRTSLMLSHADGPPKVIVVTSSVPGEGKTTNALALAQNLLGLGKRVLLVEGDIRRRTLHQYFDTAPERGIVSVLRGQTALPDAVFQSAGFGADILGGEHSDTNAADLFSSNAFAALLAEARAAYDVVIIDTPPILVVPDARIIAEQADAVIFTVQWDKTEKPQIEESLRLFHNSGQRITGLVLSRISPRGMKRYGYGGRHGAYAGYGSRYYVN